MNKTMFSASSTIYKIVRARDSKNYETNLLLRVLFIRLELVKFCQIAFGEFVFGFVKIYFVDLLSMSAVLKLVQTICIKSNISNIYIYINE